MVVEPLLERGDPCAVSERAANARPPPTDQIIVSLTANREYYRNKEKVDAQNIAIGFRVSAESQLEGRILLAEDSVKYDDAMKLMDIVRNSGSGDKKVNIGIVMDWVNPAASSTP